MFIFTQSCRGLFGLLLLVFLSSFFSMEAKAQEAVSVMNKQFAGTFVYNPRTLRWSAINSSGKVIRTGRASGGRGYCPDLRRSCRTPTGTFHVISKRGFSCKSSRYPVGRGGAPMPYCMFFSKNYAIHGSYDVPNYNASHGCIRVPVNDARWLNNNFMSIGTKVIVKSY